MKINKNKIDLAMARAGIASKKKLGEMSGLCWNTVTLVTNGKSCTPMTVYKLAVALNVDPEYLLEER